MIDHRHKRYGRLVCIELSSRRSKVISKKTGKVYDSGKFWWVRCDCGNSIEVAIRTLVSKAVMSCGCYRSELTTGWCRVLTRTDTGQIIARLSVTGK